MPRQTRSRRSTVARVMHEYKHGELASGGTGRKVKNPKQAIAIALSEAGVSRRKGKAASRRASPKAAPKRGRRTKAALMAQAQRRDIPGRSRMSKADLERALAR